MSYQSVKLRRLILPGVEIYHGSNDASVPIAEKLRDRNLPFAFVTGFEDESILPAHLRSVPRFAKPCPIASILGAIDGLAAKVELEKIAS